LKSNKLVLGSVLAILITSGCAGPEEAAPAEETTAVVEEESSAGIEVDEGLFNVEVTIPAEFFEGQTEADIAANAEESGYENYVFNADGSVTYTMSKAAHDAALQEMRDGIDDSIQEAVNASPDVFQSVTYNDAATKFDVTVDRAAYDASFEAGFISFTLGISGMFYQMFDGVPTEEQGVIIDFIDGATGEVFDTQTWPMEG
jgi:hypothetical protein